MGINVQNLCNAQSTSPKSKPSSAALKYVLLVAVLIVWIAAPLLSFSFPILSDRLAWAYLACLVALFFLFLRALLRRRWKELAILCAIFGVVLLPYYNSELSFRWLYVHAFRVHVAPVEDYLTRCKLLPFVENGVGQKLGRCESFDAGGDTVVQAFYDTTGEFVLPASQRTPEWKLAMSHFSPHAVLLEKDNRAQCLFWKFLRHYYQS